LAHSQRSQRLLSAAGLTLDSESAGVCLRWGPSADKALGLAVIARMSLQRPSDLVVEVQWSGPAAGRRLRTSSVNCASIGHDGNGWRPLEFNGLRRVAWEGSKWQLQMWAVSGRERTIFRMVLPTGPLPGVDVAVAAILDERPGVKQLQFGASVTIGERA
jgi:hypothetical protein